MRHRIDEQDNHLRPGSTVEYEWRYRNQWNTLSATLAGAPQPLRRGSEEEFITEHYWGYTAQRDGGCTEYQVEHEPWHVWQVRDAALDCDVASIYGPQFVEPLQAPYRSAFVAAGSPILVRSGVRIVASLMHHLTRA
jgi:uncharacterized protein YqjF (DUF2071 family)